MCAVLSQNMDPCKQVVPWGERLAEPFVTTLPGTQQTLPGYQISVTFQHKSLCAWVPRSRAGLSPTGCPRARLARLAEGSREHSPPGTSGLDVESPGLESLWLCGSVSGAAPLWTARHRQAPEQCPQGRPGVPGLQRQPSALTCKLGTNTVLTLLGVYSVPGRYASF